MDDALTLMLTSAGRARFAAAQLGQPVDLRVSQLGLTDATFPVAPTLELLPGEFRRVATVSGVAAGDGIVHLVVRDDEAVAYEARGFGLYLSDGTLFAVYGQADPLFGKSPLVSLVAWLDLAFPDAVAQEISFGDADLVNPPATSTVPGVVRLLTLDEASAGAATGVVPGNVLKAMLDGVTAAIGQARADLLDAIGTAVGGLVVKTRRITTKGLLMGGDTLDGDLTLTVASAVAADVALGLRDDQAVTPKALRGAAALLVTDSGDGPTGSWKTTSDGMTEQWGESVTSASTDEPVITVTLPIAFADVDYRVSLTPVLAAAATDKDTWVQVIRSTKAPDSFQVQYQRPGTSTQSFGLDGFEWRAWRRGA